MEMFDVLFTIVVLIGIPLAWLAVKIVLAIVTIRLMLTIIEALRMHMDRD